jgi:hypothetical protein
MHCRQGSLPKDGEEKGLIAMAWGCQCTKPSITSAANISLWVALQSLSQLDAIYGTARAKTLKKNMATKSSTALAI